MKMGGKQEKTLKPEERSNQQLRRPHKGLGGQTNDLSSERPCQKQNLFSDTFFASQLPPKICARRKSVASGNSVRSTNMTEQSASVLETAKKVKDDQFVATRTANSTKTHVNCTDMSVGRGKKLADSMDHVKVRKRAALDYYKPSGDVFIGL